jgi:ssDNA-binding Zn-finger/Zn-ribbon topoisomerase 1
MNQENTIDKESQSGKPKIEYTQQEVEEKLSRDKIYTKCNSCGVYTGLRKAASMGQFFYLCTNCYEKGLTDGSVIPLHKPNKSEKKAIKKQRARQLKGLA